MRVVDRVLSHMKSPHFDMRLYTDLEKLVHAAHMQDVWQDAGMAYKQLTEVKNCHLNLVLPIRPSFL